jgi:hypothetical protein
MLNFQSSMITIGFTPSLLKERTTDAVLLWYTLQARPPYIHYYCAVVLHSCIILPPVSHSSNYEYHCCQLTRQSSCVSNFCRTFKVFIWLSLVIWVRYQTSEFWYFRISLDFWYCRTSWYIANDTVMENSPGIQKSLYLISLTDVMQVRFKCLRLQYGCRVCQWEYFKSPYFSLFSLDSKTHQFVGFSHIFLASCRPACHTKRTSTTALS